MSKAVEEIHGNERLLTLEAAVSGATGDELPAIQWQDMFLPSMSDDSDPAPAEEPTPPEGEREAGGAAYKTRPMGQSRGIDE